MTETISPPSLTMALLRLLLSSAVWALTQNARLANILPVWAAAFDGTVPLLAARLAGGGEAASWVASLSLLEKPTPPEEEEDEDEEGWIVSPLSP